MADLRPGEPAKQQRTEHDEKDIRKPDQQFGARLRVAAQRVANEHKEKIRRGHNQTHGKPNRCLAAVRRDTQRHSDYCEGHTRKRERKPFVYFGAAGAALPLVLACQLFDQLLDRQRGTARPFFLFVVKLLETDRQRAFDHINSVPNLSQVGWVLFVALLVTRLLQVHENPFIRQIGFQHSRPRVSHLYRQRILIQLKHSNVFELVALLFANVNLAPGKLIDHLVASEERHRISSSKIENRAAQFFLRSRRSLHVEPETY